MPPEPADMRVFRRPATRPGAAPSAYGWRLAQHQTEPCPARRRPRALLPSAAAEMVADVIKLIKALVTAAYAALGVCPARGRRAAWPGRGSRAVAAPTLAITHYHGQEHPIAVAGWRAAAPIPDHRDGEVIVELAFQPAVVEPAARPGWLLLIFGP